MIKISWNHRLKRKKYQNLFVTVDGTDYRIQEPFPFSTTWYSHKFHGPGVRYEIGVSLSEGYIVWAHGPFPCGSFPDIRIFNLGLKNHLLPNEVVLCDKGYRGNQIINDLNFNSHLGGVYLARHETANRRLKQFNVLSQRFKHDLSLHSSCFYSVLNLTQLMIELSDPLFTIK